MTDKTELKWYEKKQGITLRDKQKRLEKKEIRKERRKSSRSEHAEKKASDVPSKNGTVSFVPKSRIPKVSVAQDSGYLFDISSIDEKARAIIDDFDSVVSSIYPLTSKQRALLPADIRALKHDLTDEREERRVGYMNEKTALSAYLHYYLWWNIVRLSRLFANMPSSFFNLKDGSLALDIGSGPLTVPIALLLARPELRSKKITWYCMDISAQALLSGENILLATAARLDCEPWKVVRVKGPIGTEIKEKVDFVSCANVFNEIVQGEQMPPDYLAKKYALQILSYIEKKNDDSRVLIIEPGVPACGRFVSLLRSAFMKRSYRIASPCTHCGICPMDGKRGGKWCNYAFSTEDAPETLRAFSRDIYIPKERAVLSFIACEKHYVAHGVQEEGRKETHEKPTEKLTFRVTSDAIRLPGHRTGYYACSSQGLLLVVTESSLKSGESLSVELQSPLSAIDEKSGAFLLEIA